MAKKYQDMDIAEKIEVKKRKIKKLFKELPSDKAQFADGLIAQFAVTSVTLERLADEKGFRTGLAKYEAGVPGPTEL